MSEGFKRQVVVGRSSSSKMKSSVVLLAFLLVIGTTLRSVNGQDK